MKIEFQGQTMTLANFNGRSELHGEERTPAGDLKLQADVTSEFLNKLDPDLRGFMFFKSPTEEPRADLADQGSDAPNLRFPKLAPPLKWTGEMESAKVTVKVGNRRIVLTPAKVNRVEFTPREGGTLTMSMRVQCHPDEDQAGRLYGLIQTEVDVTVEAEPEPQQELAQ